MLIPGLGYVENGRDMIEMRKVLGKIEKRKKRSRINRDRKGK